MQLNNIQKEHLGAFVIIRSLECSESTHFPEKELESKRHEGILLFAFHYRRKAYFSSREMMSINSRT